MSEFNFRLKRLDGYRRAYCMLKEVNWLIFDLAVFGEDMTSDVIPSGAARQLP